MRPKLLAQYLNDPQQKLAEEYIKEGTSSSPVQHWTQGLARLSKAALGAAMARQIRGEYEGQSKAADQERANAFQIAVGRPAETANYGDTTINWNEQKPNLMAAAMAAQSPDNEGLANSLMATKFNQDQMAQQQQFQQAQQDRMFGQQRQMAEMQMNKQQAMQDAMLQRQMEFERFKMQNDPQRQMMQRLMDSRGQGQVQPGGIDPLMTYALTGKMPEGFGVDAAGNMVQAGAQRKLSPTEQKELFDTMDLVNAGQGAVSSLNEAKNVLETQKPFTGFGAETLAAANRIPLVGAFINDERATATTNIKNAVTEQALNQLKAIFGGMPTEGERQVLLQLQALPSYSPQEQKMILDRALQSAQNRLSYNQQKAGGIQTGDYKTMQIGVQPRQGGWSIQRVQ